MGHDDFLQPSQFNEPCVKESSIAYSRHILPIGAGISLICYGYLLWMYFILKSPVLNRHPTTLAIYRCLFEIILIQQYIWIPFTPTEYFYSEYSSSDNKGECLASTGSAGLAFLSQFSMLGGELCFLIISMDLRVAYTNPFSTFKQNRIYYALIVLVGSIFSACMLMWMGPHVYGLSSEGFVWIQDRRKSHSIPYAKFLLYYCEIICIFIYCLWANFQFYMNDDRGLGKTLNIRLSIMQRAKRFTFAYICCDLCTLGLESISFTFSKNGSIRGLSSYNYSLKGVIAIAIIFYSNWKDITWENMNPFRLRLPPSKTITNAAKEGLQLQPHLNAALRAEILFFTTQGIMCAARECAAMAEITLQQQQEDITFSFDEAPDGDSFIRSHPCPLRDVERVSIMERISNSLKGNLSGSRGSASLESGTTVADAAQSFRPSVVFRQSEIDQLSEQQSMAVSGLYKDAYLEEIERFAGMLNTRASFANRSSGVTVSMSAQPLSFSSRIFSRQSEASKRDTAADRTVGRDTEIALIAMKSSTRDAIRETVNPAVVNNTSSDGRVASFDDSASEAAMIEKWRDTMDIEFQMNKTIGNAGDVNESSWRRAKSDSNEQRRFVSSSPSTASASEALRQSLSLAVINAKNAARSVFTEDRNRDFRFKDFCPKLFAKVRDMCNIQAEEYAHSFITTCKENFSEGRSGSFMFFSSDQRCVVKSLTPSEMKSLRKILSDYVEYLCSNPDSLLVRILGAHSITLYNVELNFMVMLNFFPVDTLSERYDLKGSWVDRHGFQANRSTRGARMKRATVNSSPLFLDNDLLQKISLEPKITDILIEQIRADTLFLRTHNLMDYSLLIGVKKERFEVLAQREHEVRMRSNKQRFIAGQASARESIALDTLNKRRPSLLSGGGQLQQQQILSASENRRPSNPRISIGIRESSASIASSTSFSDKSIAPLMTNSESGRSDHEPDFNQWRIYSKENYTDMQRDADGGLKARVVEGPGTYYMGIIDILQEWNWHKKLEHYFKSYIRRSDPAGLSAVEPHCYADRFWRRCVLDAFDGAPEEEEEQEELRYTNALLSFALPTPVVIDRISNGTDQTESKSHPGSANGSSNNASYGENGPTTRYAQVIR